MLETMRPKQTQAERDYLINRFNNTPKEAKVYYDDNDLVMLEMLEYQGEIFIQISKCDYEGDPTDDYEDITDDWLMDMEEQ